MTLEYEDEQFELHTTTFNGISARIILHEYDHIEGKLFIDYLKPLKRKLLKGKLDDITRGKISVDYKMSFPKSVRKRAFLMMAGRGPGWVVGAITLGMRPI